MDLQEFEGIYQAYFQDVYRYILKLCGSSELAGEIVSDAFFKAMDNISRFRGDCDLRVWLCQIAKNCYYSHLRAQRNTVPLEDADGQSGGLSLEEFLEERESSSRAYAALHRLPEPYKEVFLLRALGELSFRQIGNLFGKTENWACVTYHRARAKVKAEMEESE